MLLFFKKKMAVFPELVPLSTLVCGLSEVLQKSLIIPQGFDGVGQDC